MCRYSEITVHDRLRDMAVKIAEDHGSPAWWQLCSILCEGQLLQVLPFIGFFKLFGS